MQSVCIKRSAASQAASPVSSEACSYSGRQVQPYQRAQQAAWRSAYSRVLTTAHASVNVKDVAVVAQPTATPAPQGAVVGSVSPQAGADVEAQLKQAWEAGYQAGLLEGRGSVVRQEDTLARSAIKGLTWRTISTATTILLAMTVLEGVEFEAALQMGAAEFVSKYIIFFIHERLWVLVPFSLLP